MKQEPLNSTVATGATAKEQGWFGIFFNKATWQKGQKIAHRIGDFQARLLLTLLYLLIIAPVGIFWKWVEDPLRLRLTKQDGYWQKRNREQVTLPKAGRQG
jgi:hypothetical protein